MCGIAGAVSEAWSAPLRRECVARMTAALAHRGPDDEGFFDDGSLSLGFRRLSVIDLETGQQPIVLEDRRLAIVLNGEIYNFRELRRELEGRGHRFRSSGDVEVVLRLWAEEGPGCLGRLNGMFALAVWDGVRRTLHLARDRFGIKPLYLYRGNSGIAFASELRALRAGGFSEPVRLDPVQLRHYLAYGYLAPRGTPFAGVESLPPASLLSIDAEGRQALRAYWTPPGVVDDDRGTAETAVQLLSVLEAAVERQFVADVPVGVFLSGGLDSSTVTGLAARAVSGPLRTFAVGFAGPGAVSELPCAREIADHFGTDHHELMMDPSEVASDLEAIVDGLDAPLADPTAIPTWYMSRLARERVTVALSGEGADEIFGGYARQRYDVALDRFGGVGKTILPGLVRLTGRRPSERLRRRLRMVPGLARQLDWGRVFPADDVDALVAAESVSEDFMLASYEQLQRRWRELAVSDPVNGRLMTDREIFLPADLLVKVDRMSMAHSLEVRVPYLDNEVVDLMLALPGRYKQSLLRNKILLRSAAASVLPSNAAKRRKRGFEVPIGTWLRGKLRPALLDWLAPETIRRQGLLEPQAVTRLTGEHLRGHHDHGRALWALMVLSRWFERNRAA